MEFCRPDYRGSTVIQRMLQENPSRKKIEIIERSGKIYFDLFKS